MTEAEWLGCGDPFPMVKFLLSTRHRAGTWRGRLRAWFGDRHLRLVSDRKLRLFVCACCRRHSGVFDREPDQQIIEAAEQLADGGGDGRALEGLAQAVLSRGPRYPGEVPQPAAAWEVVNACQSPDLWDGDPLDYQWPKVSGAVGAIVSTVTQGAFVGPTVEAREAALRAAVEREHRGLADLVHDVVGNPFRPVAFSADWRTDTAVSLAHQMYESRDFSAMPILADALQDAGCDSDDVLNHCRGPGPHVCGCWVVDLVLGKE